MIAILMLLALTGLMLAGDLIGRASMIYGDTLEIHGMRIRLGVSMRRKADSAAGAKTA